MNRLVGFDFARALALFGMVIVNFKLAMNADSGSSVLLHFTGLFEGRASALFVILAGVGIAFMTQKARMSGISEDIQKARRSIVKRAILLIAAGLAYTPIWEADILHFYGFYFIIAAFLFNVTSKMLLLISMGFVLTFPLLWVFFDYEQGWDLVNLSYSGFWTVDGMIRHIVFNGFHPVFPWCGFLIFGMWLAQLDLTSSRVQRNLLVWSFSVLIVTEVGFYMLRFWAADGTSTGMTKEEIGFLLSTSIIPPLPQYMLSAGSSAVIVLLACLRLSNARPESKLIGWISRTGQMTLTLYVAHVIVGMGSLEALGLLYDQSINVSLFAAVLFSVISIIFSVLWLSRFRTGPLEIIFKRLSQ